MTSTDTDHTEDDGSFEQLRSQTASSIDSDSAWAGLDAGVCLRSAIGMEQPDDDELRAALLTIYQVQSLLLQARALATPYISRDAMVHALEQALDHATSSLR